MSLTTKAKTLIGTSLLMFFETVAAEIACSHPTTCSSERNIASISLLISIIPTFAAFAVAACKMKGGLFSEAANNASGEGTLLVNSTEMRPN